MNGPIPWRLFYSVAETAQLVSCSPEWVYDAIRAGERENPPPHAIPPDKVKRLRSKLCIHRSFLYPNEPTNVSPFPVNQITDVDIEHIAKRTAELVLESMFLAFRRGA